MGVMKGHVDWRLRDGIASPPSFVVRWQGFKQDMTQGRPCIIWPTLCAAPSDCIPCIPLSWEELSSRRVAD
jgi:hypothetical protein